MIKKKKSQDADPKGVHKNRQGEKVKKKKKLMYKTL